MPRGQPDFGQYQQKTVAATLSDMAELAVRLGSIVIYDQRGDVVYLDDFEAPNFKWNKGVSPGTSYARHGSYYPFMGSGNVELFTENADDKYASIYKYFTPLGTRRLGAEIAFAHLSTRQYLELAITDYLADPWYEALAKVSKADGKLYVQTTGGVDVEVASGLALHSLEGEYHLLKVVADFTTYKYIRVMLDEVEYDISTVALNTGALAATERLRAQIRAFNEAAIGDTCYLDNFIFTQNEP